MSYVSDIRQIKKSRQPYSCDWCYERIEKGSGYKYWFCFGSAISARMHDECCDAMQKADLYDEELPAPSTYRRGCYCGESGDDCECSNIKTLNQSTQRTTK